jgi:DNA processing protein
MEYINELVSTGDLEKAKKIIFESEQRGIKICTWYDGEYPLHIINDPPPIIYLAGTIPDPLRHPYIAIVGSRKPTPYGRQMTENIVRDLMPYSPTIVSGLAYGIDAIAHGAAIKYGMPTVAILGSGIDSIYPTANRHLADEISAVGAVVSEFPWGTPPLRHNFPMRNRVISGLSRGVVVVEALIKSGSLITARWAADQSREVFAVPGNVGHGMSSGTNMLIKEGAHLLESGLEIAQVLGLQKTATSGEIKNNPGHLEADNDITLALREYLESGENDLEKLIETTGLGVSELLPMITEAELYYKTGR